MSMQPFKMMIGDMVNDKQKDKAWAWQTIWSNIGSFAAYLFPFGLSALGVANVAAKGVVPATVRYLILHWSYYFRCYSIIYSIQGSRI